MTRILSLLQIKTVRSAWVFLLGSALLFLFGIFQASISPVYPPSDPGRNFEITFFSFWFLILVSYMAVASWALFSARGRKYLEAREQIPKFLFACYAASFAAMLFLGVMLLPFAGFAGLEAMFSPNSGLYLLIAGLIWSPLIFRHLK